MTHKPHRKGDPNGPRKTPKVREKPSKVGEDQVRPREGAKTPRSTSQQERPGHHEDQAEKTEGREGGEDTGTKGWCPKAERHPRTAGPRGENRGGSRPDREQQGPPSRRGVARPKQKNKKFVLSRVVSSVGSFREYTKQERRFHGCLPTVVSLSSEHKPKMR